MTWTSSVLRSSGSQCPDGSVVTVIQHIKSGDPIFPAGACVTVETAGDEQRVIAAN